MHTTTIAACRTPNGDVHCAQTDRATIRRLARTGHLAGVRRHRTTGSQR